MAHPTQLPSEAKLLANPLLSLDELSAWTQISKTTLYSLLSQGRGPRCAKVGRALRFRASDIEAWISELADSRRDAA